MEHKEAIKILVSILDKHALIPEEKEAVLTAVGVLSWSSLAESRIKKLRANKKKGINL